MSIYISQEFEKAVTRFTDAGEWKHSWHWDRDRVKPWNPITIKGAEQMLRDLDCDGSMEKEIEFVVREIKNRYYLAQQLKDLIAKAKVLEIADSHDEGCTCSYCKECGYVKN